MIKLLAALSVLALPSLTTTGTAFATTPPVGLKILVEQWNPAKVDSETLLTLENKPTAVTDALNAAWSGFRNWYMTSLPQILAQGDYLHHMSPSVPDGITLYSRGGNQQRPPELELAAQPDLVLVPNGANSFQANFHVPASSIAFCATTPTDFGKYADPCAKLSVDVYLHLNINISDTPGQLLTLSSADVSFGQFKISEQNAVTDVLILVSDIVAFFGGPDYLHMLSKTIDNEQVSVKKPAQQQLDQLNARVNSYEQTALSDINKWMQPGVTFSRVAHLAVWAQSNSAQQSLTVLLAPPQNGIAIDSSRLSGQFSGTLTFEPSVKSPPATCADLNNTGRMTAQVQTGPRPVLSFDYANNPRYGTAPGQALSMVFTGGALQGSQCSYTLSRLALGLPNYLNLDNVQYKASGMPQAHAMLDIEPSHWGNPVLLGANGLILSTGNASAGTGSADGTGSGGLNSTKGLSAMVSPAIHAPQLTVGSGSGAGASAGGLAQDGIQLASSSSPRHSLDLLATDQTVFDRGQGALPRNSQAQIGKVNPGDPALNPAASHSQATSAAPSWGTAATATMPGTATLPGATMPGTTMPGAATLPGATSSVAAGSVLAAPVTSMKGRVQQTVTPATTAPTIKAAPGSLSSP